MCIKCQSFLYDFLQNGLPQDHKLAHQIRRKSFQKTLPEFANWCARMHKQIPEEKFREAVETAHRIAKRGRSNPEYDFLIQTATFNFLKCFHPWMAEELNYMKVLLIESGCIKTRNYVTASQCAHDYISYMLPRVMMCLHNVHDDHVHPKGLLTDIVTLLQLKPKKKEDLDTCYDKDDDYQKEILEEVTDDLYT